jgi:hypothetical protein
VVKVLGDILIVERMGIKIIRSAHKLSLFLETDFEDQLYRFYPFEKINKYEAEEIKTILLDTDNLLFDEDIRYYQQEYQQQAQVQNGALAQGYQEEKKRREALERKVKYLNDKVNELNKNIEFQDSLIEKSNKKLEKTSQKETIKTDKKELSQKIQEIQDLKNKIRDVNFYAKQELDNKNKEIKALKENIAKLIRLHSAAKPKAAALLPEDIGREKRKLNRRKQKLKEDRIKLMKQRAKLMEMEKIRRMNSINIIPEQKGPIDTRAKPIPIKANIQQKEIAKVPPPPIQQSNPPTNIPKPTFVQSNSIPKYVQQPTPPPVNMRVENQSIKINVPPPNRNQNLTKENKKEEYASNVPPPSFSSNLKRELNELISQAKCVSSSLDEGSTDLTDELHGISTKLMKEREKLIKELETERDSLEQLTQAESLTPITIISTNQSQINKKPDQSRLVKVGHGRRTCPVCGNQDKYPIKEVEDKENIISYNPRIYGKKYICGDCMAEWRQGTS